MSEETSSRLAENESHWPAMAEDLLHEVNEQAWDYACEEVCECPPECGKLSVSRE